MGSVGSVGCSASSAADASRSRVGSVDGRVGSVGCSAQPRTRRVAVRLAGRRDHLPDVGDREPRRSPDSASLVRKRPSRTIFFVTVVGGVAVKRFPVNGSTSSRGYHRRRRASMLAYHNNNDNIDNDNNTNINNNRRSLTKTNVIITPRS